MRAVLITLGVVTLIFSIPFYNDFQIVENMYIFPLFIVLALCMEIFPILAFVDRKIHSSFIPIFAGSLLFGPIFSSVAVILIGVVSLIKKETKFLDRKLSEMLILYFIVGITSYLLKPNFKLDGFLHNSAIFFLALLVFLVIEVIIGTFNMLFLMRKNKLKFWLKISTELLTRYIIFTLLAFILCIVTVNFSFMETVFASVLILAYHTVLLTVNGTKIAQYRLISSFTKAVDARDEFTKGRSESVKRYGIALVKELNLPPSFAERIAFASQLHDLGRMYVERSVLRKKDGLSYDEYLEIKQHAVISEKITKDTGFLREISNAVRHHHEYYDGTGFPDGLKGKNIPLEARILTVADSFDAMTKKRAFRDSVSEAEAKNILKNNSGSQFDPEVVAAFLKILDRESTDTPPYAYIIGC